MSPKPVPDPAKLGTVAQELARCRRAFRGSKGDVGQPCCLIHHTGPLLEYLTEPVESRIKCIMTDKPEAERARRLREMRPWPGTIPTQRVAAQAKYDAAWAKYDAVLRPPSEGPQLLRR